MIIPMKKARLIILKEDRSKVLLALQRIGEFMVISPSENDKTSLAQENSGEKAQMSEAMLRFLNQFCKKPSILDPRPEVNYQVFSKENDKGQHVEDELLSLSNQLNQNNNRISFLENQNANLKPWHSMDIKLENIHETKDVDIVLGYFPENISDEFNHIIKEYEITYKLFDIGNDGQSVLLLKYKDDKISWLSSLKSIGFVEVSLSKLSGTPDEIISSNKDEIKRIIEDNNKIMDKISGLNQYRNDLALLNEQVLAQQERNNIQYIETIETICLYGWVCSDKVEKVESAVSNVTKNFDLAFLDPKKGEIPPTVTRNNRFLAQFETITDMFSLPKQGTIDPAPVAGIWYWIIYGMMMGDVGYGAIMAVLFYLFKKIKKPKGDMAKLVNVLYYSSFTTIFFGFLFGSYFGETWHPLLFAPLDNPIGFLVLTLIIGVLHIFSGMGIQIAQQIKNGHILDAFFDQVSWMVLIVGLGFLFLPSLKTIGQWMAIGGAVVILLTAGRDRPNLIGKITGGLLGLYDISSYMSDILSYSRILALSLATGVIGMVMNLLARMVSGSIIGFVFAILIYILGHTFNLAMSMLSAFVHDSRLQYIEFFNKFYEGGGLKFKPLAFHTKYIDISDMEKDH
ncbi:MAG: V-type ATP synthase subunit I [Eubacteriaceae bacterium]|nr:V-type ATP synthase subunit I [Eubacteriaceae bacterium]